MKKHITSIIFILCTTWILNAQKDSKNLVIPDSSQSVVITSLKFHKIYGKIVEQRGDTLLVSTPKDGILFFSKKNIKYIETKAQSEKLSPTIMLKFGGLLTQYYAFLDIGLEFKLNARWTVQLSRSVSSLETDDGFFRKVVWSPQLRYYFNKNSLQQSEYCGLVFQNHSQKSSVSDITNGGGTSTNFTKWGIGLLGGAHFKVSKRLGIDMNFGGILEKGNVITIKETRIEKKITELNEFTIRPFWTLNLYLAF